MNNAKVMMIIRFGNETFEDGDMIQLKLKDGEHIGRLNIKSGIHTPNSLSIDSSQNYKSDVIRFGVDEVKGIERINE